MARRKKPRDRKKLRSLTRRNHIKSMARVTGGAWAEVPEWIQSISDNIVATQRFLECHIDGNPKRPFKKPQPDGTVMYVVQCRHRFKREVKRFSINKGKVICAFPHPGQVEIHDYNKPCGCPAYILFYQDGLDILALMVSPGPEDQCGYSPGLEALL